MDALVTWRTLRVKRTNIETRKSRRLLGRQLGRVRLGNAQLGQTPQHRRRERARAVLVLGAQAVEQRVVLLRVLVKHARVERGRDQIVRGRDGVNVAGEVQVELLHRDDLRPAAAGRAALDAERGAHRRLPHAREDLVAEHGAKRLTANGAKYTSKPIARVENLETRLSITENDAFMVWIGMIVSTVLGVCSSCDLRIRQRYLRPMVVVDLPSPSGVGLMPVTTT